METLTYKEFHGRERWKPGPWDSEPDKVQWADPATGLPCLVVRGPMGSWCGYVGVGPTHPLYGKDYSNLYETHDFEVHGGLTFSDRCRESSREAWEKWRASYHRSLNSRLQEATRHPQGDSAEFLREWAHIVDDYDKWSSHMQAVGICHVAGPDDFEPAWWFGFDTAHGGDKWPDRKDDYFMPSYADRGTYRTLEYVQSQCAALAKQLSEVKP